MNMLPNTATRVQEQSIPFSGPVSAEVLPHGRPEFSLSSHRNSGLMHGLQNSQKSSKPQKELSHGEQQELRRKINSRERKRMQDLNIAMDALREVMVPYASSHSSASSQSHQPGAPPGRRLSKISTLVLARNYILLLGSSLQEMRRLLGEVSVGVGMNTAQVPRLMLAGGWPLNTGPSQVFVTEDSLLSSADSSSNTSPPYSTSAAAKYTILSPGPLEASLGPMQWSAAGATGGSLCPCGVCRVPRFNHSTSTTRFQK